MTILRIVSNYLSHLKLGWILVINKQNKTKYKHSTTM